MFLIFSLTSYFILLFICIRHVYTFFFLPSFLARLLFLRSKDETKKNETDDDDDDNDGYDDRE